MKSLERCSEIQKEKVEKILASYKGDWLDNIKIPFIFVGSSFEPSIVIIDKGELGLDFVDREGNHSWLNSIGEHHLLQFLIDKQFNSNVVRNSKRILGGE